MCGIVGYIGNKNAVPILIDGLKRLEYRGYDSAGLVIFDNRQKRKIKKENIQFVKAKGKVAELEKRVNREWNGNIGIAHTRWATHGEPNERNAHPHGDCNNRVFVCHNGIIENYREIKEALISRKHIFKSETDTEVLAHLIEEKLRYANKSMMIEKIISEALKPVRGTYGLAIMLADRPEYLIAVRNFSPLIIGIGKKENIIASDASAILGRTKNVVYMNDGEMAVLTKDKIKLFNMFRLHASFAEVASATKAGQDYSGQAKFSAKGRSASEFKKQKTLRFQNLDISKRQKRLDWTLVEAQKNSYPHFMLKEIFEQPESISNSLRGRLIKNKGLAKLGGLETVKERLRNINRLIITGCGTAYLAGLVGKYMIEEYAGLPCDAELASELRYRNPPAGGQNLAMVAISQSGETADTLAVLEKMKEQHIEINGKYEQISSRSKNENNFVKNNQFSKSPVENNILTLGIVNVVGSTIAREIDAGVYNHAGSEIGVASTKAFTSQLTILALLTLFLGRERGVISPKMGKKIAQEIEKLPQLVSQVLKQNGKIKEMAKEYKNFNNFLYIGRKYNFPITLEGALKLKEISYVHAEGCGAGEMKHEPLP